MQPVSIQLTSVTPVHRLFRLGTHATAIPRKRDNQQYRLRKNAPQVQPAEQ